MLLSDVDLTAAIRRKQLGIEPYDPALLQPASIDLRLGDTIRVFVDGDEPIDPAVDQEHLTEVIKLDWPYLLQPGTLALGCTHEHVALAPGLAARVEGKSSMGRLGLAVHVTAGFIDPGFAGRVTLELFGVHRNRPVTLYPGMRIAQLSVITMLTEPLKPYGSAIYGSHYQDQDGPTPSRAHERFTCYR